MHVRILVGFYLHASRSYHSEDFYLGASRDGHSSLRSFSSALLLADQTLFLHILLFLAPWLVVFFVLVYLVLYFRAPIRVQNTPGWHAALDESYNFTILDTKSMNTT